MAELVRKVNDFLSRGLWRIDLTSLDNFKAFIVRLIRLILTIIRELNERELNLRAMSLVYTTLLSLVPLMAFSFSILKAFGVVDSQLEPFLMKFLEPLGAKGIELSDKIMEFVQNMKVGVLGTVGLVLLIYTVISLIQKIENSLNHIWKVTKGRSFARRLSDYISIILIGPVLIFAVFGLTASLLGNSITQKLASIEPFGAIITIFAGKMLSYIMVSAIFTFIYIVIPNSKVKFWSALIGGLIAGLAWEAIGWGFAKFVVSSTKYAAIYSSFAIVILFMIWLYLNWLIVLIGSEISYCHQNLKFLSLKKQAYQLSYRLSEKLSLLIMYLIGYNYYHDKDRWTLNSLVDHLGIPQSDIHNQLKQLKNDKLILETGDTEPAYIPAKDLETIKLKEIVDSVRKNGEERIMRDNKYPSIPEIDSVTDRIDESIHDALGEENLKNLILSRNDI